MKHFNFCPTLSQKQRTSIARWYYISLASCTCIVLVLLVHYFYVSQKLTTLKTSYQTFIERNQALAHLKQQSQELAAKQKSLQERYTILSHVHHNQTPDYFLVNFAELLPNTACLTSYSCDEKKLITMTGNTQTEHALSEFMHKLAEQPNIQHVALVDIKRDSPAYMRFTINCRIMPIV